MNKSERTLNKEQLQAIKHKEGPLLIIAGAGTGKTTVITERIKFLISSGLAKPEEILALTFTEKASQEMQERIDVALPLSYGEMWIMTFHSFCDRILRDNAIQVGLPGNYKLMTEAESVDLIKKNLFEFNLDYFRPLGNPNKFVGGLLQHFSRLQDETINPEEYLKFSKTYKNEEALEVKKIKELAEAYKAYDDLKIKEGKFDFGDLILKTLGLFQKRPNILKEYQKKFKYILIDEFQDTNYSQNQLAILLAGDDKNITVVLDDDQAIYRWRGASVANVIQFRKNFPNVRLIVLSENYRNRQEILNKSYKLIQQNNPDRLEFVEGINKKLVSKCKFKIKDKKPVEFIHCKNDGDEAERIAKQIRHMVEEKKDYGWRDIAILVRANNHADPIVRELERNGIPHQFLGPSKLFEKEEVIDLISYLKTLKNIDDSESFYRLLSSEIFDISALDLIKITNYARKNSLSIFEVIAGKNNLKLQENTTTVIDNLLKIIDKHLKLIRKETAGFILYDYVKEIRLFEKLLKNEDEVKTKNITKFFEKIKSYEYENRNAGVNALVDYIDLLMEVGESPIVTEGDWQENNVVNILTVHSSKGLEFKVVFLVNLVSDRFPSRERHEQIPLPKEIVKEVLPEVDFHLQEERRLFYVGMTRAKEKLYLTAADYYGDGKRIKKISPFVYEALEKLTPVTAVERGNGIENTKVLQEHVQKTNQRIKIDYLSVSQIETFQICPLHYKLRYIYKLPTEPTSSISFGIAMHCALRDFYKDVIDGKKPSESLILGSLEKNWVNEGYSNKKHKKEFFEKGKRYLKEYLKQTFDLKRLPRLMEEKFTMNLGNGLKIGGTFDRVDELPDGSIEIIDYKTGESVPTQKEVDKDLQLGVYALAATKMKSSIFNKKPEEVKLSLYYFEGQQKITTTRTAKDLEKLEKELFEIKEEIETSDFKCSNHYFCQMGCEFKIFCKTSDK